MNTILDNSNQLHLLTLPREIRDEIYKLWLPEPETTILQDWYWPSWFYACKQIYTEAVELVLSRNCKYVSISFPQESQLRRQLRECCTWESSLFWPPGLHAADYIFLLARRSIRYLAVDIQLTKCEDDAFETLAHDFAQYFEGLEAFTGLRKLYISLGPCRSPEWDDTPERIKDRAVHFAGDSRLRQAMGALRDMAPKECDVKWCIPAHVRQRNPPFARVSRIIRSQVGGAMQDVCDGTMEAS